MPRYIDADKLTDKLEELQFDAPVMTPVMKIFNVIELVEDQPAADVVEVKHGEWKPTKIPAYFGGVIYECSLCGAKEGDHSKILGRYCWRCGAKMDGGENNGGKQ